MSAVRSAVEEGIKNTAENARDTGKGAAEGTGRRSRSWTTNRYNTKSTMAG